MKTPTRRAAQQQVKKLTIKQVFTKVRDHLLQQNRQSVCEGDHTACAYRGLNGLSCAVGCLIADALYRPEFEGLALVLEVVDEDEDACARRRRLRSALRQSGIPTRSRKVINMLSELQHVHDEVDPAAWPAHLNEVGIKFLSP